eukprot:1650101-Amphidinium_carterae.1
MASAIMSIGVVLILFVGIGSGLGPKPAECALPGLHRCAKQAQLATHSQASTKAAATAATTLQQQAAPPPEQPRQQPTTQDSSTDLPKLDGAASDALRTDLLPGTSSNNKTNRDALLQRLRKQEEALRLLQTSGATSVAEQVSEGINSLREALREVEPAPKRLQSLQLGIQRRKQKMDKLHEQRRLTQSEMDGLEGQLEAEMHAVRVRFRAKRTELELKLAEIGEQEQHVADGLHELREVQGGVQVVVRVMEALALRHP